MRDRLGNTPLQVASKIFKKDTKENIEILKLLLKHKATALQPDSSDCYPIDIFCMNVSKTKKYHILELFNECFLTFRLHGVSEKSDIKKGI